MKDLTKGQKQAIAVLGVTVLVLLSILFWMVVIGHVQDKNDQDLSRPATPNDTYLALLELDQPHTFASDADAIQYGRAVCYMLEDNYIEDFDVVIENDHTGMMRGVSLTTKAAGVVAASIVYCPEWADEVRAWANN